MLYCLLKILIQNKKVDFLVLKKYRACPPYKPVCKNGVEEHTILQLRAKIRKNTLARSPEVVLRALLHLWVEALSGRDTSPDIVDHLSLSHRRREKNSLSFLFFLHPLYLTSFHAETGHGVEHLAPKWTGIKMFSALCKKKKNICKRKKNDT